MKRKIEVEYYWHDSGKKKFSHRSEESWVYTDIWCPKCGILSVWVSDGDGDYCDGPQHICTACAYSFYLHGTDSLDDTDKQRLEQLSK